MNNLNIATESTENQNEADALSKARDLYITLPLPTLNTIGKAVGIHPKTVGRWRDRENWDLARLTAQKQKLDELEASGISSKQSAKELLETCQKIQKMIAYRLNALDYKFLHSDTVDDRLLLLTNVVAKINELQKDAYKRL